MVRLHVRLEHGDDRGGGAFGLLEIRVDERLVRIDHGELPHGEAAEEIRRAGSLREQKRTQDHGRSVRRGRPSR